MIHINEIPLDFEPRRKILPKLPACPPEPEMNEFESAFLCGALKQFRPKKILEVGVAGGATTAIILQTLEDLGEPYEMHSVDVAEKFYLIPSKPSGFIAMFAKEKIFGRLHGTHEFHLGKVLPQIIDDIGGDMDFVILDTMHILPGEVLDFIAMLPYLKDGAVVVLHDVSLNQIRVQYIGMDATTTLFGAVTAEKFLNFCPEDADESVFRYSNVTASQISEYAFFRYPNIAAFQVSEHTSEHIDNVFLALILRWKYLPTDEQLVAYRKLYRRFYPVELCEIFQEAVDMNAFNFMRANHK